MYQFVGYNKKINKVVNLGSVNFMADGVAAESIQTVATKSQGSAVKKNNGKTESYDKTNTASLAVLTTPTKSAILGLFAGTFQSVQSDTAHSSNSVTVLKSSNLVQKA
uniref:Uncharacterized protein n=1 Tax=viral metagenome TaxID=1070528 RepID=A0A6C0LC80_9ZZZZ